MKLLIYYLISVVAENENISRKFLNLNEEENLQYFLVKQQLENIFHNLTFSLCF